MRPFPFLLAAVAALAFSPVRGETEDALDRVLRSPGATGALLVTVNRDGEAYRAGLREGDIVLRYAGKPVLNAQALTRLEGSNPAGSAISTRRVMGG